VASQALVPPAASTAVKHLLLASNKNPSLQVAHLVALSAAVHVLHPGKQRLQVLTVATVSST